MRRQPGSHLVGDFKVKSGKMIVSDPCYHRGTWCAGVLDNVKDGKWIAIVDVFDGGDWGSRISVLRASAFGWESHDRVRWELTDIDVGVDSGQVCLADEAVYPQGEDIGEYGDTTTWYGQACAATGDVAGAGIFADGRAVNSSSGYGDGSYHAYIAKNDTGEIVAVKVVFIGDESYCEACGELTDEGDLDSDGVCYDCRTNGALEERDLEESEEEEDAV